MQRYQVIAATGARFNAGTVLKLSKGQAARRAPMLEEMGRGRYRVVQPVEFKRGEEIGVEGAVSKATLQVIEPVKEPAPPPAEPDPAVTAKAAELKVDLSTVTGTGENGAVTMADVEAAAKPPADTKAGCAGGLV